MAHHIEELDAGYRPRPHVNLSMNYQPAATVSLQVFAPGPQVLQGEFVAVDHLPFNPQVIAKLIFEYEPASE